MSEEPIALPLIKGRVVRREVTLRRGVVKIVITNEAPGYWEINGQDAGRSVFFRIGALVLKDGVYTIEPVDVLHRGQRDVPDGDWFKIVLELIE